MIPGIVVFWDATKKFGYLRARHDMTDRKHDTYFSIGVVEQGPRNRPPKPSEIAIGTFADFEVHEKGRNGKPRAVKVHVVR
jgi:hypothetical protein